MTGPSLDSIEQLVLDRLSHEDWHPFRPLKVFCLDGQWIMAFRCRAIAFGIYPTQSEAFSGAETIAEALREKYPAPRV